MILEIIAGIIAGAALSGTYFLVFKKSEQEEQEEQRQQQSRLMGKSDLEAMNEKARKIIEEAESKGRKVVSKARKEAKELKDDLLQRETRLEKRMEKMRGREDTLSEKESDLAKREQSLKFKERSVAEMLEKRAGLTRKEAEKKLLEDLKDDLVAKRARLIKEAEEQADVEADERAQEILVSAMENAATDYVSETTVTKVQLPSDEMKGRVIGKEGRNIKALEEKTGVDFEIDETPKEVRISSFDPVRREIAKRALERLVDDGRIQPSLIEETVRKVENDLEREIRKAGKDIAYNVGVSGLPSAILDLLGKLKFRTSYGQNQMEHTLEVVKLARALAKEVNAREDLTVQSALLHDIGKVETVEKGQGSHVELGKKILKKHGFSEELVHTAMAHHRDEEFRNIEAALVYIADAISGSRPGARMTSYDDYVERIEHLEDVAKEFSGVDDVFALSAGREVRVLVDPGEVSDDGAVVLAHEIAEKIQEEATYPGTVKVNVIRETRASDVAK